MPGAPCRRRAGSVTHVASPWTEAARAVPLSQRFPAPGQPDDSNASRPRVQGTRSCARRHSRPRRPRLGPRCCTSPRGLQQQPGRAPGFIASMTTPGMPGHFSPTRRGRSSDLAGHRACGACLISREGQVLRKKPPSRLLFWLRGGAHSRACDSRPRDDGRQAFGFLAARGKPSGAPCRVWKASPGRTRIMLQLPRRRRPARNWKPPLIHRTGGFFRPKQRNPDETPVSLGFPAAEDARNSTEPTEMSGT